jgi:hypothetical protein
LNRAKKPREKTKKAERKEAFVLMSPNPDPDPDPADLGQFVFVFSNAACCATPKNTGAGSQGKTYKK